jgi:amino acid transporter
VSADQLRDQPGLKRALGAFAITVYAVGDVLGAGIYALVGKVVGEAGSAATLSFGVSAVIALFTGLTYAELSSRCPYAGGAAAYCKRAYPYPIVAFAVGILVLASGISSAATISLAMTGYLEAFIVLPKWLGSLGLLLLLSWLNYRSIEESARVNLLLTAIEVFGLLFILAVGLLYAADLPAAEIAARATPAGSLAGVLGGATLAFFAYIGFEDTANVAEEVRDARRVLPRAILTAIGVSCVLYISITLTALLVVPREVLSVSGAPLLEVLNVAGVHLPGNTFSIIALVAICNTGLLNLIMASRLLFGMAQDGLLPQVLARVHPQHRTPSIAVWAAFAVAAFFALSGGVEVLAKTTSFLLLTVFATLHVGLLRLKRQSPAPEAEVFVTPAWTPAVGGLLCAGMALQYPLEVVARAAVVLVVAVVLYMLVPVKSADDAKL